MSTVKDLRLQARLSVAQLAKAASIDRKTVERAEEGLPIQDTKAYAILSVLNAKLGTNITLSELEGLVIL